MLGLGPFELVLVFFVMLLLFGAKRLPELASGMGKGIRDFKRAVNGLDEQAIQTNAPQSYVTQGAPVQQLATPASVPAQAAPAQGEPQRLA